MVLIWDRAGAKASRYSWGMIFSDLPSPAEASIHA
jgi:hypothetical protein